MKAQLRRFMSDNVNKLGTSHKWDRLMDMAYFMECTLTWVDQDKCQFTPISLLENDLKNLED